MPDTTFPSKSAEEVQDDIGTILDSPLSYDDAADVIKLLLSGDLQVNASDELAFVDEEVQDLAGALANTGLTYDDAADALNHDPATVHEAGGALEVTHNNLTLAADDHHTKYTDENAQDAVGTILGTLLTYDDATPSITVDEGEIDHDAIDQTTVDADDHHAKYTDEEAQDAVGTNVGTGLSYEDPTGTISNSLPNVPNWVEDGNSPLSASGSESDQYTLSNTYDIVMVLVHQWSNNGGSQAEPGLRVEGDSGSNYNVGKWTDGQTINLTEAQFGIDFSTGGEITGDILISGRWTDGWHCSFNGLATSQTDNLKGGFGENSSVSSPLSTITFGMFGSTQSIDAEIYGRDIT